jgi:hypothetical protein
MPPPILHILESAAPDERRAPQDLTRHPAVTAGVSATNVHDLRLLVRRALSLKSPAVAVTVHEATADFLRVSRIAVVGDLVGSVAKIGSGLIRGCQSEIVAMQKQAQTNLVHLL